jgi:hypothetical protein
MDSHTKRPKVRTIAVADGRRSGPKTKEQFAVSAIEVEGVVRYGRGPGCRIEFTIGCAGHRVRLGLPAKHVLSYGRIGKAAMEEGLVLPYDRSANRAWRRILARAMERARVEPLLEGEEIAEAVAEEIRALLEGSDRGDSASDLMAGKVVER